MWGRHLSCLKTSLSCRQSGKSQPPINEDAKISWRIQKWWFTLESEFEEYSHVTCACVPAVHRRDISHFLFCIALTWMRLDLWAHLCYEHHSAVLISLTPTVNGDIQYDMRSLQESTVSVDQHLAVTLANLLEERNKLYKTQRVVCPLANTVKLSLWDQICQIFLLTKMGFIPNFVHHEQVIH